MPSMENRTKPCNEDGAMWYILSPTQKSVLIGGSSSGTHYFCRYLYLSLLSHGVHVPMNRYLSIFSSLSEENVGMEEESEIFSMSKSRRLTQGQILERNSISA